MTFRQLFATPVLTVLAAHALGAPASAAPPATAPAPDRVPVSVALPIAPYAGNDATPVPAPAATRAPDRWDVQTQDVTLSRTLERWAARAGYRLKWDAQRNFLIGAPDTVEGSFENALQAVLGSAGIRDSDYPLEACIYANQPPLVRVTRLGEQAGACSAS